MSHTDRAAAGREPRLSPTVMIAEKGADLIRRADREAGPEVTVGCLSPPLGYSGPTQTAAAAPNPMSAAPNDYGDGILITLLTGCSAQNVGAP